MRPSFLRINRDPETQGLVLLVVGVVALFLVPTGAFAGDSPQSPRGSGTGTAANQAGSATTFHTKVVLSSKYDWPELHKGPTLDGYASNSPLSSLNASNLGVAWATNVYGSILDSPAVAYDPVLHETLAYVGTETGDVLAVNLANGQIVWGVWFGSPIRSSLLVNNGSVFIIPFQSAELFKLNATTGATQCSTILPSNTEATPTAATLPGGGTSLFIGTIDSGPRSGPFLAISTGNCNIQWKFTGYNQTAGSWDSASYVVNASGGPMVLFGTDNPDSSVYALDAVTGKLVWRFQCYNPAGTDFDVADGAAISPPGVNGFAQGVAYVTNKAGRAYALDLNNGTLLWETNFNALAGTTIVSRSTPALDGKSVVFGFGEGLFNLNAVTGAVIWKYLDPSATESLASPAIAGGHGHGIAITGDIGGSVDVVSMIGGKQLYTYQTDGYFTGSPAVSGGNIVIGSSDGYLYDFAVGGGNNAILPATSVGFPLQGATLANSAGNLTAFGNATDSTGVVAVNVAVQASGAAGSWWDAATGTWSPGPVDDPAFLGTPGGRSTSWSLAFPVPLSGGTFQVIAYAVSSSGQSDPKGASVDFSVGFSTSGPHLEASPAFVSPGGSVIVNGGGFGKSAKVVLTLLGKPLATVTSFANGTLPPTSVVIPLKSLFGPTSLVAAASKSGKSSSAAITIANSWEQLGDGPGHTGFEPNDTALSSLIFLGGGKWVVLAWEFDAGAAFNSSPSALDGVLYVADTVGNLYALDDHNGGILWNFTLSSAAAIDGTPAIDPALGLVIVGANDGTVDAVYLSNGTLAWSTSIGGDVSAPVSSNGEIYVSSSTGAVKALAASTGTVSWSKKLGSAVTGAPALNASVHLLVVGESNGDVVALNASTGATRWTFVTGGAVTASAMITGGTVYVGSNDHRLYALDQKTGAKVWSFLTGGAVQDTGTIDSQGLLYIGSNDGHLYVLHLSSGSQAFTFSIGSPIVGVSSAKSIAVYETANGNLGAEKTYFNGGGWNFTTGAGLVTSPVILDGTVYVSAGVGILFAFTSDGQPPV
jgi:outer membrane protein assembly factor BamB